MDILVNNARICKYHEVVESEDDNISKPIHLNVGSMAMLSKFHGKDMKDQRRGRKLKVSSVVKNYTVGAKYRYICCNKIV